MNVRTDTKMPPMGVVEEICTASPVDKFMVWLATHDLSLVDGARFWRVAVLRECLPNPDGEFEFGHPVIVGCYTLDLYCQHRWPEGCTFDERHYHYEPGAGALPDGQFTGRTYAECKRNALARGWKFHRRTGEGDVDVTCPVCAKHGPGTEKVTSPGAGGGLAAAARRFEEGTSR